LFLIYINGIPDRSDTKLGLFVEDTALLARGYYLRFAMQKLQRYISLREQWFTKWSASMNLDQTIIELFNRG
jgi:hypothetical protein